MVVIQVTLLVFKPGLDIGRFKLFMSPLKKRLKIPKGNSEAVHRRKTDSTKEKGKKGQTTIYK